MAKTVSLSLASSFPSSDTPLTFIATVTNSDSAAVTLSSLSISEQSKSGATIGQPQILTPNAPPGVGSPTLLASASLSFPFQVVFPSPNMPGPSPQNVGGAAPSGASPAGNTTFQLVAVGQTSDGSVFTTVLAVSILSAVAPFPVPSGGAAQFGQGSCSNLIAVIA